MRLTCASVCATSASACQAEDQKVVFRRFTRGSAAERTGAPGTGLGLALAQHIATVHGGALEVESTPGAGSVFSLRLPVRMTRILLAEDDAAIALVLRDDLRLEGYEVEHVSTGDAALARIETDTFDLVLLDVMMPGRDGFKVCEEARRRGHQVPILFVTARSLEAERILGFRLGADDYIVKPFSSIELRARVEAVLRRTRGAARGGQVRRFGDVTLDLERWELRRGETTVPCSTTELKVLASLVQARGRVLTRRQIVDEVWGTQTFITERVVDNHVLALRKKIRGGSGAAAAARQRARRRLPVRRHTVTQP